MKLEKKKIGDTFWLAINGKPAARFYNEQELDDVIGQSKELNIKGIKDWFQTAIPEPTIEQACMQIGCHFEEVAELFEALGDYDMSEKVSEIADKYKECTHAYAHSVATLNEYQKTQVLDALCDQKVTAIGVAHMLKMDIEGALDEVNGSNYSKFEDGKPVFNEQGKIAKGNGYKPPMLDKFV